LISLRLLLALSISHLRAEWLKTLLAISGMALGIAMYFAIQTAITNSWEGFVASAKLLTPDDRLRLESAGGEIPESLVPRILKLPGLEQLSPQSSRFVDASSETNYLGTVQILGVDALASRGLNSFRGGEDLLKYDDAVLVSSDLAKKLEGKKLTVRINGSEQTLRVSGVLPENGIAEAFGGQLAVLDIAHFQDLFQNWGRVDTLFLSFVPDKSRTEVELEISKSLPESISLAKPDENTRHAEKMSESFRLNLSFLSAISLFVALFLIYNTTSFAALKRRRELSLLRSLGISSRELLLFLSLENLFIGLLGALLGIGVGYFLALTTVKLVSLSFSTLYLPIHLKEVRWKPEIFAQCLLLGPALSFIGGAIPIFEVLRLPPRETTFYEQIEGNFRKSVCKFFLLGVALFFGTLLFAKRTLLDRSIYNGFISPSLLLLATACVIPAYTLVVLKCTRKVFASRLSSELLLALDHIETTLRRSSLSISAIVVATGTFIGLSIMILSFRQTVNDWIHHITKADIYVSNHSNVVGPGGGYLPENVVEALIHAPEAADYDYIAGTKLRFNDREVRVNGMRFDVLARHDRLLFKQPMNSAELQRIIGDTNEIFASETFATRNNVAIGDRILLPGLEKTARVKIANIFYDYSSDQGVLLIPDSLFSSLFEEARKQGVSLYLREGVDAEAFRAKITQRFRGMLLSVRSNKSLREEVLKVFDDTFRITYALQAISLSISALTMLNTVLMLMLERKREFAVFRAIGARRASIAYMTAYESVFLGALALILSLLLGLALAAILVFVINQFFFGWSVRFVFPSETLVSTSLAVILLSLLAGFLPGYLSASRTDVGSLSYE